MPPPPKPLTFKTPTHLHAWFEKHHATETELWVRMFKKDSGIQSVDWNDCVLVVLAWGWIDGHRKSFDEVSFIQRLTPRKKRSNWSTKNRIAAEKLIAEGRMRPPGLAQVEAAKADGRWEKTSASPSQMVIPDDFLAALAKNAKAKKFFATLNRQNLFSVYYRLHSAKKPETRAKRIEAMVAMFARGERFY